MASWGYIGLTNLQKACMTCLGVDLRCSDLSVRVCVCVCMSVQASCVYVHVCMHVCLCESACVCAVSSENHLKIILFEPHVRRTMAQILFAHTHTHSNTQTHTCCDCTCTCVCVRMPHVRCVCVHVRACICRCMHVALKAPREPQEAPSPGVLQEAPQENLNENCNCHLAAGGRARFGRLTLCVAFCVLPDLSHNETPESRRLCQGKILSKTILVYLLWKGPWTRLSALSIFPDGGGPHHPGHLRKKALCTKPCLRTFAKEFKMICSIQYCSAKSWWETGPNAFRKIAGLRNLEGQLRENREGKDFGGF